MQIRVSVFLKKIVQIINMRDCDAEEMH
jgi:hypothetical protein